MGFGVRGSFLFAIKCQECQFGYAIFDGFINGRTNCIQKPVLGCTGKYIITLYRIGGCCENVRNNSI